MGYIRHHAIVVTSTYDHDLLEKARLVAASKFAPEQVSAIVRGTINDTLSFFIGPDGSKEGWEHSDEGDDARDAFISWLRSTVYEDGCGPLQWVEIQYGDDDYETLALRSSDTDASAAQFDTASPHASAVTEEPSQ